VLLSKREEPESWIKASPEALAMFFYNCNKYQEFREEFLRNPKKKLNQNDIFVSPEAEEEIKETIKKLYEKYGSELGMVPDWREYGLELIDNGWGVWIIDSEHSGFVP
jgi:hypothetical protein